MKKILFGIILSLMFQLGTTAEETTIQQNTDTMPAISQNFTTDDVEVFSNEKGDKFGLKDKSGNVIFEPQYLKLIRVGNSSWIVQKKSKYGLINSNGEFIIQPKYRHVERLVGRFVKLGNTNDFGVYDEKGNIILPPEYSDIQLLYGKMFLTKKDYKYGVASFDGTVLIDNICDDIYMPQKNVMRLKLLGDWYEIERTAEEDLTIPEDIFSMKHNDKFKLTALITDTGAVSGYSVVTFSDYLIKIFSSISPAHEETIDDLMLSKGADTVSILKKCTWIPKYPLIFAVKYYHNIRDPYTGPLADVRTDLKKQIK